LLVDEDDLAVGELDGDGDLLVRRHLPEVERPDRRARLGEHERETSLRQAAQGERSIRADRRLDARVGLHVDVDRIAGRERDEPASGLRDGRCRDVPDQDRRLRRRGGVAAASATASSEEGDGTRGDENGQHRMERLEVHRGISGICGWRFAGNSSTATVTPATDFRPAAESRRTETSSL
jgi:hypothetical protein